MTINNRLQKNPVAIIGLSSIFAQARNIDEFWTNIITSKDSITDVPENRWNIEDYYDSDINAPDKTYCKKGGFLPEINFNPLEFGLPPNLLEVTDSSQLLGLIAARDAFFNAGYGAKSEKFTPQLRAKTGVILGVGGGQKLMTSLVNRLQYPIWEKALRASGIAQEDIAPIVNKIKKAYVEWNENSFPGLLGNVVAGRISNRFDLGGINSVVDAACAASLSAIKMALSELLEGRSDMMLTGGVDTDNSPLMYMSFSKTPAFSKSGNIRPFSDDADGMLIGEGLGMLVLKRLDDAERDGDRIYAVIKGIGTSSDGRYKSIYAPRSSGQALAMNRAYEDAGYAPSTVGLIEAHGTGTVTGDPVEFNSMKMVFEENNPQSQHIALGSVKSQIGHTKSSAGAAGVIKAALSLHHKILPPTINVEQPNSKLDIQNSAFYINTESRPWLRNGHPRRAGVSAFGFGGINVHLTLEEYGGDRATAYRLHQPIKTVLLWADDPAQLQRLCQAKLGSLQSAQGDTAFQQLVTSSEENNPAQHQSRLGFVTKDRQGCIEMLEIADKNLQSNTKKWDHPKGIYFRPLGIETSTQKVSALFSGQGSQYVGMGKESANAFPPIHQAFEQVDTLFYESREKPLSAAVFPIPVFSDEERLEQKKALTQTQCAQPAIGALSMGQYKVFQQAGFQADFTAGHSFGELTALWAANAYDDATFLSLAKARGSAMAAAAANAESSGMLAVKASQEEVELLTNSVDQVNIVNINSNKQVVLGGSSTAINEAQSLLNEKGLSVVPLPVSAAFHTKYIKQAQQPFSELIQKQVFNTPQIPVYSNMTGEAYPHNVGDLKATLSKQMLMPVLFKHQIENMYQAGARIFVEFGPKGVLTNLVNDTLHGKDYETIAINPRAYSDSDMQLRQAAVLLRVIGLPLKQLDPFVQSQGTLETKTKFDVKISGNNYFSATSQKAYQDALNDGVTISKKPTKNIDDLIEAPPNTQHLQTVVANQSVSNGHVIQELQTLSPVITDTENTVAQEVKIHDSDYKSSTTSQFANPPSSLSVVSASIPHQVVATEVNKHNDDQLANVLLEVVSHKTGYPAEMLELSMDMEADLGIDSIKRVEIFGALTQQYPDMAKINPNELAELRTLKAIVDHVGLQVPNKQIPGQQIAAEADLAPPFAPAQIAPANGSTQPISSSAPEQNNDQLVTALLEVVSDKTGYPAEMLELTMDMEADLGIDSIKRVEIFGALTQQYPDMATINPSELAELRTLKAIVDHVGLQVPNKQIPGQQIAAEADLAPPFAPAQIAPANGSTQPISSSAPEQNNDQLVTALLEVVSDKTGYPAEMLELTMDMEADLGIDSIKRVEIFGALTQQYPDMATINPSELAELRTLKAIVDHVGLQVPNKQIPGQQIATEADLAPPFAPTQIAPANESTQSIASSAPAQNNDQLATALLEVVSDKTGYPAEMLELTMDMEADLGIDSIKRVEIFGALTQQYPDMATINPSELAELRTLKAIVDHVGLQVPNKQIPGQQIAAEAVLAPPFAPTQIAPANESTQSIASSAPAQNNDQLATALLEVVSDKTGYPAEMLELTMDMEADLGIDSIKRVEIFGALTQQYPDMAKINPSELAELRTLDEIVNHVSNIKKKTLSTPTAKPIFRQLEQISVTTGLFHGVCRKEIALSYLPQPDYLEFSLPADHVVLIVNGDSDLCTEVCAKLKENTHKVVVLNLPVVAHSINENSNENSIELFKYSDSAVREVVKKIHQSFGQIGALIHLHPHFETQQGNFSQHFATEKNILKSLFLLAKHLQSNLTNLGEHQRSSFLSITRMDGKLGQSGRHNASVVGGGITGLVKCLNLEWPSVYCRAVDFQPELSKEKIADQIIAELHDPQTNIVEVGFAKDGRSTSSVFPVEVNERQEIQTTIGKQSVFLVSGGARGVTARCAIEMARAFHCKFILLGRSSYDFELPTYAMNEHNPDILKRLIMMDLKNRGETPNLSKIKDIFENIVAKKEIDDTIAQIKACDAEVIYLQGDITQLSSFKSALNDATNLFGDVTGILHGAGRLADKLIQNKTEADFDNVLSVKLDGLLNLLNVANLHQLDHLILFSSVAGFYGNSGQTDYAIANEILSKAAHLFKTTHPSTHVSAINWGAWDSGMVSPAIKKKFEAEKIDLVNAAGGAAMLVNEFNVAYAPQAQVIIGGTLPAAVSHLGELRSHRIKRRIVLESNPFLQHHIIQGNPVLPIVNVAGWMMQACEDLYPDFCVFQIKNTQFFKGIVFDGTEKEEYILEINEHEKDAEKITFKTTILSKGGKLPSYHYKATVILVHRDKVPKPPKFTHHLSGNYKATQGEQLYKDGSLFHGKYFQGIKHILDCNEERIVLSCSTEGMPLSDQGQFPVKTVNTFFADINYQGVMVWVQRYRDGANSLPVQAGSATFYKKIPFGKQLFVTVDIREANDFNVLVDCTAYDAEGTVYMLTQNAAVTISKQLFWQS